MQIPLDRPISLFQNMKVLSLCIKEVYFGSSKNAPWWQLVGETYYMEILNEATSINTLLRFTFILTMEIILRDDIFSKINEM